MMQRPAMLAILRPKREFAIELKVSISLRERLSQ